MKPKWIMTNGDSRFDMEVCTVCGQPYRSGHVDCSCPQNHPERCARPTYQTLLDASLKPVNWDRIEEFVREICYQPILVHRATTVDPAEYIDQCRSCRIEHGLMHDDQCPVGKLELAIALVQSIENAWG